MHSHRHFKTDNIELKDIARNLLKGMKKGRTFIEQLNHNSFSLERLNYNFNCLVNIEGLLE